jgi:hypothetical protein
MANDWATKSMYTSQFDKRHLNYTTRYRGISYLTRLSSESLKISGAFDERHMKLPSKLKQNFLSMDCIGIRQIQWLDQNSHPVTDESP